MGSGRDRSGLILDFDGNCTIAINCTGGLIFIDTLLYVLEFGDSCLDFDTGAY